MVNQAAETIIIERGEGLARMTLNNPARKNAITTQMAASIEAFCSQVEHDESIGAVIVDSVGGYETRIPVRPRTECSMVLFFLLVEPPGARAAIGARTASGLPWARPPARSR